MLAKTVCQALRCRMRCRFREQARSHMGLGVTSDTFEQCGTLGWFASVGGAVEALHEDVAFEQPALHQAGNG